MRSDTCVLGSDTCVPGSDTCVRVMMRAKRGKAIHLADVPTGTNGPSVTQYLYKNIEHIPKQISCILLMNQGFYVGILLINPNLGFYQREKYMN